MFNHISNTQLSSLPYTRNGSMNDSSDEDEGVGITFSWMGSGRLDNYPICDQDERVILDTKINFFTIRFIDNNDSLFIKPKFYQNCNEFKKYPFYRIENNKEGELFNQVFYPPEEVRSLQLFVVFTHHLVDPSGTSQLAFERLNLEMPKILLDGENYEIQVSQNGNNMGRYESHFKSSLTVQFIKKN